MIPKAEVLAIAEELELLPTTIEKDYVLGWVLFAVAAHPDLSLWIFKGGTCLKKCYFDTYRFSEDLDFTVPPESPYDTDAIRTTLQEVSGWVYEQAGIEFPEEGFQISESVNKRGELTFQAKLTYLGPLEMPRASRQRIKFDLTRDEIVVDSSIPQEVFHGYSDRLPSAEMVSCYSVTEILAEKIRALHEREGRARDVYDVVNIGRNLREEIPDEDFHAVINEKFRFKDLEIPTVEGILSRVDAEVLARDWSESLKHQLPMLPPVEEYLIALEDILRWFLTEESQPELESVPGKLNETLIPRIPFIQPLAAGRLGRGHPMSVSDYPALVFGGSMERVRFAARNRLLVQVMYKSVPRLVEPYSLRMPTTGNLLLYVHEIRRGYTSTGQIKAFKVTDLGRVNVTDQPFIPRYRVEL